MKYYVTRGGLIINSYDKYYDAVKASLDYPGSKILKDVPEGGENKWGSPARMPNYTPPKR
jgi:hypothetical protein